MRQLRTAETEATPPLIPGAVAMAVAESNHNVAPPRQRTASVMEVEEHETHNAIRGQMPPPREDTEFVKMDEEHAERAAWSPRRGQSDHGAYLWSLLDSRRQLRSVTSSGTLPCPIFRLMVLRPRHRWTWSPCCASCSTAKDVEIPFFVFWFLVLEIAMDCSVFQVLDLAMMCLLLVDLRELMERLLFVEHWAQFGLPRLERTPA